MKGPFTLQACCILAFALTILLPLTSTLTLPPPPRPPPHQSAPQKRKNFIPSTTHVRPLLQPPLNPPPTRPLTPPSPPQLPQTCHGPLPPQSELNGADPSFYADLTDWCVHGPPDCNCIYAAPEHIYVLRCMWEAPLSFTVDRCYNACNCGAHDEGERFVEALGRALPPLGGHGGGCCCLTVALDRWGVVGWGD